MRSTLKYLFYYIKSMFQPAIRVSDADAGIYFDLLAGNEGQCNYADAS